MHRLSLRGDPTQEQEQKWSPDSMMESLLAMQEKPMGKVRFRSYYHFHASGRFDDRIRYQMLPRKSEETAGSRANLT